MTDYTELRAATQKLLDENDYDLSELLDMFDPDWRPHYGWDEFSAFRTAMEYGMPEFHEIVKEYLE